MKKFIPAISVVIPMYNAEKYIGECLESIFAQTFQDFEVIVVDDCSTDNSCAVVEKYSDDKLKLIRRKFNSGYPGIPSNIGMKIACGEYIFFMDNDDLITKTAFEEMYSIAKKFDADVVACEKYFQFNDDDIKNFYITSYPSVKFVTEPTLITENFAERVTDLQHARFLWNMWSKLIRRNYLIENAIEFINAMAQDVTFTCCLICSAEKFVRVPNIINFYRVISSSLQHQYNPNDVRKRINLWINFLFESFNCLKKFLNSLKNFQDQPNLKYVVQNIIVGESVSHLLPIYQQIPAFQLDKIIRDELAKFDNKDALTAFIFNRMNIFNINLIQQQQMIQQLQK